MEEERFADWLSGVIRNADSPWMGVPVDVSWDTEDHPDGGKVFQVRFPSEWGIHVFEVAVRDVTDLP